MAQNLNCYKCDLLRSLLRLHRVSKKTSTHIIGYKLRNSYPILIIFYIKIPHIIWHRKIA